MVALTTIYVQTSLTMSLMCFSQYYLLWVGSAKIASTWPPANVKHSMSRFSQSTWLFESWSKGITLLYKEWTNLITVLIGVSLLPIAVNTTTASHITQVVNNAVKDQLRRKKNVIISGLPESNDMSDADAVRSLCEEYIGCKPWFDDTRCKRIGQAGGNPRRLLVTLATDQAAAELLYSAKRNLRKADPSSLASKVYFNPDLSPEEAKQAYLKRQERRQRRNNQQSTGDNALLNPLAPSFQTEAC